MSQHHLTWNPHFCFKARLKASANINKCISWILNWGHDDATEWRLIQVIWATSPGIVCPVHEKLILQLTIEGRKLWNWRDSRGGKLFALRLLMRASASWSLRGDSISSIEEHRTPKSRLKSKTHVWRIWNIFGTNYTIRKPWRHHHHLSTCWNHGNIEGVLISTSEQMSSLIDVF